MNLHEYFSQRGENKLSQQDKLAIYNKFLAKKSRHTRPSLTKRLYSLRYTFSIVVVFVLAFGSYYSIQPSFISDILLGRDNVQAVNVAQIIYAQGIYTIQGSDSRKIVGTDINDGDVIGVDEGSFVEIKISDSHVAKVAGPASFQVLYVGDSGNGIEEYRLKMLSNSYVAVESIKEGDAVLKEGQKEKNLVLITDDGLVINQTKTKKPNKTNVASIDTKETQTRFVVQKLEGKSLIDNSGSEQLTVTHEGEKESLVLIPDNSVASLNVVKDSPQSIQAVLAKTVGELQELVSTIQPIQDALSAGQAMGIMQTGTVQTGVVVGSGQINTGIVIGSGSIGTGITQTGIISTGIVQTGTIKTDILLLEDKVQTGENIEKNLLSSDQSYKIQQLLNATLLKGYVEKLAVAYMGGQNQKVITQKSNIMATLNSVYEVIGSTNPYIDTTSTDLLNSVNSLINKLVSLKGDAIAINNLDALASWIKLIYTFESGKYVDISESVDFSYIDKELGLTQKISINFK